MPGAAYCLMRRQPFLQHQIDDAASTLRQLPRQKSPNLTPKVYMSSKKRSCSCMKFGMPRRVRYSDYKQRKASGKVFGRRRNQFVKAGKRNMEHKSDTVDTWLGQFHKHGSRFVETSIINVRQRMLTVSELCARSSTDRSAGSRCQSHQQITR